MKTRVSKIIGLFLALVILAGIPGSAVLAAPSTRWGGGGGGGGGGGALTQAEAGDLQYMREEEKMAHDVYIVMYAKYGLTVFSNISSAESNHMAAVKNLLDRYDLPDPTRGNGIGEFTNATLQSLYSTIIARGNQSSLEALLAGGTIEEVDIYDLKTALVQTNRTDIINVFTNLKAGSCNHLRAFATQYTRRTGLPYPAQFLTPVEVQAILNGGC